MEPGIDDLVRRSSGTIGIPPPTAYMVPPQRPSVQTFASNKSTTVKKQIRKLRKTRPRPRRAGPLRRMTGTSPPLWQLRYLIRQTQGGWLGEVWGRIRSAKSTTNWKLHSKQVHLLEWAASLPCRTSPHILLRQIASLTSRFVQSLGYLMNPQEAMHLPEGCPVNVADMFQREGIEWLRFDVSGKPTTYIDHDLIIRIIRSVQAIWTVFAWIDLAAILAVPIILMMRRNRQGPVWWLLSVSFGLYAVAYLFAETWYASYLGADQFIGSGEYNALPCGQPLYAVAVCAGIAAPIESFQPKSGNANGEHGDSVQSGFHSAD